MCCYCVSNPWREAIEATARPNLRTLKKFPILGGRLLKQSGIQKVSLLKNVSNPWREAIEAGKSKMGRRFKERFPILGGRLLKLNKDGILA